MTALDFRVLTVRPPWSAFITAQAKTVENRTWQTHYRGLLAIHAGVTGDRMAFSHPAASQAVRVSASRWIEVRGAIVALADLVDCHPLQPGCCSSQWADRDGGVFHWSLANVRPLPTPVPAKGRLGLWIPDPDVAEQVTAQLVGVR
jgi:hypothetical protein